MKNKIIEAILKLNPTAEVSVRGEDINSIAWENGTPPISKEDIAKILLYAIALELVTNDSWVNPLPSPTNAAAVTTPTIFTSPKAVKVCPEGTDAP